MSRVHLLYDVWVQEPEVLRWVGPWPALLRAAAEQSGATVLAEQFHQFEPHGVTGILLLSESHISVHTWPEEGLAVLDLFTCGGADMAQVVGWLRAQLRPHRETLTTVERGVQKQQAGV